MARRTRDLTPEERQLWIQIARTVTIFRGRTQPEAPLAHAKEPASKAEPAAKAPGKNLGKNAGKTLGKTLGKAKTAPDPRPAPPATPAMPPLAPIERRTRRALGRGSRAVDAVLDLHGMRQVDAHAALRRFLHGSQAQGHRLVLVITGKGGVGQPGGVGLNERGVLRRVVPHWLRLPDLRPLVVGFEEATLQHGGAGSLYVRLRRPGRG